MISTALGRGRLLTVVFSFLIDDLRGLADFFDASGFELLSGLASFFTAIGGGRIASFGIVIGAGALTSVSISILASASAESFVSGSAELFGSHAPALSNCFSIASCLARSNCSWINR